jgi:hypothetical protein
LRPISIQYLEYTPELSQLLAADVVKKLRRATETIPLTHLLIGWDVPQALLEACQQTARDLGLAFYRWQPLLTGDGNLLPRLDWQTIGLDGKPVAGFREMPEFTFICPNRPAVQQAVEEHIQNLAGSGLYDGLFLDRIRFPSPAGNMPIDLACFCPDCAQAAAQAGIDLPEVQRWLRTLIQTPEGRANLVRGLFHTTLHTDSALLQSYLEFRCQSIIRFVQRIAQVIRTYGLRVGLDCFSPCLAYMVGQDLNLLGQNGDWVKVMSYAHTLGPAGMPFEILGLWRWLTSTGNSQLETSQLLAQCTGFHLPPDSLVLERDGFSPRALHVEADRALQECPAQILLGVALVDLPGPALLSNAQITADLQAIKQVPELGLALSWDLRLISLERLRLVAKNL